MELIFLTKYRTYVFAKKLYVLCPCTKPVGSRRQGYIATVLATRVVLPLGDAVGIDTNRMVHSVVECENSLTLCWNRFPSGVLDLREYSLSIVHTRMRLSLHSGCMNDGFTTKGILAGDSHCTTSPLVYAVISHLPHEYQAHES